MPLWPPLLILVVLTLLAITTVLYLVSYQQPRNAEAPAAATQSSGPYAIRFVDHQNNDRVIPLQRDNLLHQDQRYAVIDGLDLPVTLSVTPATNPEQIITTREVNPRHHQVAVTFNPSTGTLNALDGLWHSFTCTPGPETGNDISAVSLAGSFNGWSPSDHPMTHQANRTWWTMLRLPPGIHLYKFVLQTTEGGPLWINDTVNSDPDLEASDGHEGINSAFRLGPDPRRLPEARDDHIEPRGIHFDPTSRKDLAVNPNGPAYISIRTQPGDISQALLWFAREPEDGWTSQPLSRQPGSDGFERFSGYVPLKPDTSRFYFELRDGTTRAYLGRGDLLTQPQDAQRFAFLTPQAVTVNTPDWARDVVWYQIFPERFRNGDTTNDPGAKSYERLLPWTSDWWTTQPNEVQGPDNFYHGAGNVWQRRYGGDIQGVKQQLKYLRRLGVNAIYFNPVFEAASMHKYDASDFRHIDSGFGARGQWPVESETDDPDTWVWTDSDKVFLQFLVEAKKQGFRVIIDGVFNHVGREHPAFIDVLMKGKDSPYADWFEITDWGSPANWGNPDPFSVHGKPGGIQWKGWGGDNGFLPELKRDPEKGIASQPYEHIFAVTERWLAPDGDPRRGVDGWRLDVANEVPSAFWRRWRAHAKAIKPEAFIAGEIWTDATPWLQGDQFDAVMNYRFADAAQDFFMDDQQKTTPTTFAQRLREIALMYPADVAAVQMNLFGSHDTDRLASMFMNPDRSYDGNNRLQDGNDYDISKPTDQAYQRMIQAVACQMTYLGAPMIYYGDEVGMHSPDDPSNRMPMWWADLMPYDNPDFVIRDDVFNAHQRLIAIRSALKPLRRGTFRVRSTDDDAGVIIYERITDDATAIVVINRSPDSRTLTVDLGQQPTIDWMNPDHAELSINLEDAPDARPTITPRAGISLSGTIDIQLGPWGVAILGPAHLDSDSGGSN